MRPQFETCLPLVLFFAGCISSPHNPRTPEPAPEPSSAVVAAGAPTSWTFSFAPGLASYRILRSAVIESNDTTPEREISTNLTHESITLQTVGDTVAFIAAIDTFATTTQGMIGAAQAVQLPLQLTGSVTNDSLIISGDSLSSCIPLRTALITDVHNLLPRLPALLSPNSAWRDSTNFLGCQGSIPTRLRLVRAYKAVATSSYENIPVLVIQRADTIHAEGEGAQQQHRLLFEASGTGNATYYLDASSGRILRLVVDQNLSLTISASGRQRHFRQSTKQEFLLVL